MTRIDAHQHFWNPARGDYGWMPPDNPTLSRVYGPDDLAPHLATHGVEATVLVQAAQNVHEAEYMLGIADASARVAGVVGWIDFENPSHKRHLERLAQHDKFLGVRPMIQDLPDDDWMLRADIQWAFEAICAHDLTFDCLGFPRHLANFHTILTRYPDMRAVIDHCMKPQIRDHADGAHVLSDWAAGMRRLAAETGAYCKLSGIVTEAAADWTVEDLRPYAEVVLDAFGPDRVMWGSDWPVCRLAGEYDDWMAAAESLTAHLSASERERIFGGTAVDFYRLAT